MEIKSETGSGRLGVLTLAALGVVYGDIGTSPLYAIRECFSGEYGISLTQQNILGVLALIFWSLILIISVKYLAFIMRADNRGEGGILALTALVAPRKATQESLWLPVAMGLFGAALLYGDGMITPAISVLSAVEGLRVATPAFLPYVEPITIVILFLLFSFQRYGTGRVGTTFGPITLVWFGVLALLGIRGIMIHPDILLAVNPAYAISFFARNHEEALLVLGAVFLVVTGGEALYADMGHFGRLPIRLAWFSIVLPALLLNYFGQGALLLGDPSSVENPFYRLAPSWALYPLVFVSTLATVIASQAIISGAFSLTRQAIQLGFSPRLEIIHTSEHEIGQIYIPQVNWALALATISLVLGFQSSSNLAAAYGMAVTMTMVITTVLFYLLLRRRWRWKFWRAAGLTALFLAIDLAFFLANSIKIEHGGWFPLLIAVIAFSVMTTWKRGREILGERLSATQIPFGRFLKMISEDPPVRVAGTAIYMTGNLKGVPHALLNNLKHNHVLHERIILLTVLTEEIPTVDPSEKVTTEDLGQGIARMIVRYGFMEDPDIPAVLRRVRPNGEEIRIQQASFFLGRETLLATPRPGMALWREKLFAFLSRNALRATSFFRIPASRVVEFGTEIEL